jgi:CO/xanthine dehydrogenase Mo-binding subunit
MDRVGGQQPIGGETRRLDAYDKVTGETNYVEDISMPGLLYAKVLRSPYHHARLLSLDGSVAAQLPGVIRIITADDIPGVNGFPGYSRDEPILTPVGETVKAKGAAVALVVANSSETAYFGLQAIKAEYDLLAHTFDLREAINGVPQIYKGGNLLNKHQVAHGDLEKEFAKSDVIIEASYQTAFQEHSALERESALGYIDEEGRVIILGGTHEPHWQQQWIAEMLQLDLERVRFITVPMGGSFGGKQDPWPNLAAALAAYIVNKPVQLVFTRGESFEASPKRHPYHLDYKIGATSDGRLMVLKASIDQNTGAYDADGYYIPEYAVVASGGAYHWEAVDAQARSFYTNAPKCGQFRGFGTPQSTFALECSLDELAQKLGEDPIEFRLKNIITQSSNTFLGYPVAESLGYRNVLESLQPRYQEFQADIEAFNAKAGNSPYRKGVGVAGMWYRFGKSGSLRIEAHAELSQEGHFIIYCSAPDYGQGTTTTMAQLAAETLGISRDQIQMVNADTALTPDSGVQGASRATYWVGNAVCEAAKNLKMEIISVAAEMLDRNPDTLTFADYQVVGKTGPTVSTSLSNLAAEFEQMGKPRKVLGAFDLSSQFLDEKRPMYTPHFATGGHLAEVCVDMETGEVKVTRFVAVHDVGRVINQMGAEGQVEGGVIMGLGSALTESYLPGKTKGFSDYILPMIGEIPEIEVLLVEVPSYQGPMGAKGLGETATLASTPAIINAVSRAIGARVREIPATPERVLEAIHKNRF